VLTFQRTLLPPSLHQRQGYQVPVKGWQLSTELLSITIQPGSWRNLFPVTTLMMAASSSSKMLITIWQTKYFHSQTVTLIISHIFIFYAYLVGQISFRPSSNVPVLPDINLFILCSYILVKAFHTKFHVMKDQPLSKGQLNYLPHLLNQFTSRRKVNSDSFYNLYHFI
jgi:hypothetical protein